MPNNKDKELKEFDKQFKTMVCSECGSPNRMKASYSTTDICADCKWAAPAETGYVLDPVAIKSFIQSAIIKHDEELVKKIRSMKVKGSFGPYTDERYHQDSCNQVLDNVLKLLAH